MSNITLNRAVNAFCATRKAVLEEVPYLPQSSKTVFLGAEANKQSRDLIRDSVNFELKEEVPQFILVVLFFCTYTK